MERNALLYLFGFLPPSSAISPLQYPTCRVYVQGANEKKASFLKWLASRPAPVCGIPRDKGKATVSCPLLKDISGRNSHLFCVRQKYLMKTFYMNCKNR